MPLLFVLILIAVFATAWRFGTDSRDGRDWASAGDRRATVRDMVPSCC